MAEFTALPLGRDFHLSRHCSDSCSSPSLGQIKIKCRKTDPFSQGVEIYLGQSFNELCPTEAIVTYLTVRGYDRVGPFFQFHNGTLLFREQLVTQVCQALLAAG